MNGHFQFCSWCCNLRCPLCCQCKLCIDCCQCCAPSLPCFCPPQPLPQLPCLGPPPAPIRIIREQILVPVPYPVYPRSPRYCMPNCWEEVEDPCSCNPFSICRPRQIPCCIPQRKPCHMNCCDPCRRPQNIMPRCREQGCMLEDSHPCPWPLSKSKRLHQYGQSITPGYKGHVPGMKFHSAGRSFGQATRDTCCIMSQWRECCPQLPCRIFEQ